MAAHAPLITGGKNDSVFDLAQVQCCTKLHVRVVVIGEGGGLCVSQSRRVTTHQIRVANVLAQCVE